jgi:hypothetical protein
MTNAAEQAATNLNATQEPQPCGDEWHDQPAEPVSATPVTDAFELEQKTRSGPTRYPDALQLARKLERELAEAKRQFSELEHNLYHWGIIEISVRNPSVAGYMKHWEGRAESAEARAEENLKMAEKAWIDTAITELRKRLENERLIHEARAAELQAELDGFKAGHEEDEAHILEQDAAIKALQAKLDLATHERDDLRQFHEACVKDLYEKLGVDGSDGEIRYKWAALAVSELQANLAASKRDA